VLDLGAGTGDLSFETLKQNPDSRAIAADFTLEMMKIGRERPTGRFALWSAVDALNIPFPDNTFDAVISGFLLRNVIDLPQALAEQYRVLKPGGRMISLDTTKPRPGPLAPLIAFHMHTIIPALGKLLTGEAEAYTYLPDTSENFLLAEDLAEKMRGAGFGEVAFQRRMFGVVAIHWGVK
jgi:demethylmenaquinone methyltransferase/2-methoxy-6-polyprenyl-1,4-benzoquinol methylase